MADFAATHLGAFALDLCAAFIVAWFFAKYYPRLADYHARRSRVAAKNRADKLEKILREYEQATTNPITFVGRIVGTGVSVVVWLTLALGLGMWTFLLAATEKILCTVGKVCDDVSFLHTGFSIIDRSIKIFIVTVITLLLFAHYRYLNVFRLECAPNYYRFVMQKRIERLRSRVP
jgi:ABC-type microcin C transport system permease subunit YejB